MKGPGRQRVGVGGAVVRGVGVGHASGSRDGGRVDERAGGRGVHGPGQRVGGRPAHQQVDGVVDAPRAARGAGRSRRARRKSRSRPGAWPAPCRSPSLRSRRSDPCSPTVIVYVTGWPGTAVVWPSVLVTDRSAWGVSVSVSVAVLLAGFGSTPGRSGDAGRVGEDAGGRGVDGAGQRVGRGPADEQVDGVVDVARAAGRAARSRRSRAGPRRAHAARPAPLSVTVAPVATVGPAFATVIV